MGTYSNRNFDCNLYQKKNVLEPSQSQNYTPVYINDIFATSLNNLFFLINFSSLQNHFPLHLCFRQSFSKEKRIGEVILL